MTVDGRIDRPGRACGAVLLAAVVAVATVGARQSPFNAHDDHTEYDLLDPATHQFHIVYYLNQRTAGATTLLNQTRSGSAGLDVSVSDPQTGEPLRFEYQTGAELAAAGESGRLSPDEHYIRAHLPRPVPEGGEGRVRIEKTYLDDRSYDTQGEDIVFARSLGIGRNAIVLPAGYSVVSSNVAGQIAALPDGRVRLSFENVNGYASDVQIRGRRTGAPIASNLPVVDRAFDFAKTLYDLGDPASHRVAVRHEYVATAPGPRARLTFLEHDPLAGLVVTDMDTGKPLEVVRGGSMTQAQLAAPIRNDRQSAHLRLSGDESDPRYRIEAGQLAWEHTLHEPRTTILLPEGWEITALTAPGTISHPGSGRRGGGAAPGPGRVAIEIVNPRLDTVDVALRATRRPGGR